MPYIREAMASLARQTYRRFEVIVQDAASRDGTREFIESFPIERLDVVSEPDSGIGDAFNRAFARCQGALVTSLDADNTLEPDALRTVVPSTATSRTPPRHTARCDWSMRPGRC